MFAKRKFPQAFFYLLLVFLLLLGLSLTGIFRPLRALAEKTLIVPLKEKLYDWQRIFKRDLGECQLKNATEVAELKTQVATLTEENREQKKLLSSPLPKNWQFLAVKVIGLGKETLTISQGKNEGVREGMIAISGATFLGRVTNVSEEMAEVRLPSFFEERLMVRIIKAQETISSPGGLGLSIGRGQGKMRVEQILATEEVAKGDLVMTNLEGGDLLVGEVEEVVAAKGEVFKTAQVKRVFNPENLGTIFLVKGKI
jgi:cell shape-determining protein MreC